MDSKPLKYAIVEYCTQKNFCNVYDAVGIERLEWEIVSYDREKRMHLDRAAAYVPISRVKVMLHQVLLALYVPGWKMEVFGGSFRDDGIESRLFKVEYDPGPDNRFGRFPFRVSLAIGPGKKTATGGIAPDGKPTTQIAMRFPEEDFLGICLEVRDFLLVHQRDLERVRSTEQATKMQQRQSAL